METAITFNTLAKMIDHSLLHPSFTDQDVIKGCELAKKYKVASACVKPYAIERAKNILVNSGVAVCAVIAFPHGNSTVEIKIKEAENAIFKGAIEIDMVVNIGKVLSHEWDYVSQEIKSVNDTVVANNALLKVIFENDYLNDEHIIKLCELCSLHHVAFVKTSTGYGFMKQSGGMYSYKGATDHDLKLMRKHSASHVQIKAAGGIRTLDDVLRVRKLGVTRIGATATDHILTEAKNRNIQ